MKSTLFVLLAAVLLFGCKSSKNSSDVPSTRDFDMNDLTVQEIFDMQDRRAVNEILAFLEDAAPTYRYLAAMAMASVQDTSDTAIQALGKAADEDTDESVRIAAVYALGQAYHEKAVKHITKAFRNDDATGNNRLNSTVLEAIGKCGNTNELALLLKPEEYNNKDTLLLEGQSWGVYRLGLRDITSVDGTQKMVDYITDKKMPNSVRLIAANYLGRAKIDLAAHKDKLLQTIREEKDDVIKATLVRSMRKVLDEDFGVMAALKLQFAQSADYQVKLNILRILKTYEYDQVAEVFFNALEDKNEHVKLAGIDYFKEQGKRVDVDRYYEIGGDSSLTDWRLQTGMMGAALANVSYTRGALRTEMNERLTNIYKESKNPYKKSATLNALAGFAVNYKFIIEELQNESNHPYVRTQALEALVKVRSNPKLQAIFGEYYSGVAATIRNGFKSAVSSGDAGLAAAGAAAIRTPKFKYNVVLRYDYDFLKEAQPKYNNPKGMEAYYEIQKTIDYIEGNPTAELPKPEFNHPINWSVLQNISPKTRATFSTDKGDFTIQFFYKDAPGSVANFIKLANDGFFDGKTFHRVIGNFVAQGGCPRGDGYGALEYSIRSELADLKYDEAGYVGMASAGKDTEGVQFFITHAPTPHLDGKYTIFAKVDKGMDIVHQLLVGDTINKVTIGSGAPKVEQ